MSSRSVRNTLTTIAMAEGVSDIVEKRYRNRKRNKTIMTHVVRLKQVSQVALKTWPDILEPKDEIKIAKRLSMLGNIIDQQRLELPAFTSFSLGMLLDLQGYLKDKKKIDAVEKVINATLAIHRYFDPQLSKPECYEDAGMLIEKWKRLEA